MWILSSPPVSTVPPQLAVCIRIAPPSVSRFQSRSEPDTVPPNVALPFAPAGRSNCGALARWRDPWRGKKPYHTEILSGGNSAFALCQKSFCVKAKPFEEKA